MLLKFKMNKENKINKGAAGLRRSAIVERIRLREEWSALKETDNECQIKAKPKPKTKGPLRALRPNVERISECDVLRGVVALVEVGGETRALPLRAALAALGATVVPSWTPLVTHLVWSDGGCRATRAKARALASRLVSPLWVEACAAASKRLPEHAFPAAARQSDLPSPLTLRRLLKKAELENISITELLSSSVEEDKDGKNMKLRLSSDHDTSTDKSRDTTDDTTGDTSRDKTDVESRVNTAPRRPAEGATEHPPQKAKRKLFTQREGDITQDSDAETPQPKPKPKATKLTPHRRRELARAERIARRLLAQCAPTLKRPDRPMTQASNNPRVVLTGMTRVERRLAFDAVKSLHGRVQSHVNRKTTHILLGSCREDCERTVASTREQNISGVHNLDNSSVAVIARCGKRGRTLNALLGAARGCKVLYAQWALDSAANKKWLYHFMYEVPHLRKISQIARVERSAFNRNRSEYAYDVFNGMRVRISPNADQKPALKQLLTLCGAIVYENQDGGPTQNGVVDLTIGTAANEVSSKWVFDSVAAARMRTVRRYVNHRMSNSVEFVTQTTCR